MKQWIETAACAFAPPRYEMTPVQGEELLNEALEGNKWAAISAAYNLGFQRGAQYEKNRQKKTAKH